MRLIDADALARIFMAKSDMAMGTLKIAFANAEKMVELMPTIEAEPVRHGRWEIVAVYTACTLYGCACGWRNTAKTKYCANCGAKMDLEGE